MWTPDLPPPLAAPQAAASSGLAHQKCHRLPTTVFLITFDYEFSFIDMRMIFGYLIPSAPAQFHDPK